MSRALPSTRALQVFSAVARHQSLTRAAEELSLTHSALSQQLRKLEAQLGVTLLRRGPGGVALTEAGRRYRELVDGDLLRLNAHMVELMARREGDTSLAVGVVPVLAERWLVPRLERFLAAHPRVSLHLQVFPHNQYVMTEPNCDVALHYADAVWAGAVREPLMPEDCVAVCSPRAPFARRAAAGDFRQVPLLHLATRPQAWQHWFAQPGAARAPANPLAGHRFDLFSMLVEAARAGLGAGLVPRFVVEREMRGGELVLAHRKPLEATQHYAMLVPAHRACDPAVATFVQWLREEAALPAPAAVKPRA
jgi:DNA-binding transcriptional LysR family regulator